VVLGGETEVLGGETEVLGGELRYWEGKTVPVSLVHDKSYFVWPGIEACPPRG
jgi:hypothetical protein